MLWSPSERLLVDPDPEEPIPEGHWDPVLAKGGEEYHHLVEAFLSAGVFGPSQQTRLVEVGLFFVKKTGGPRVITDCGVALGSWPHIKTLHQNICESQAKPTKHAFLV